MAFQKYQGEQVQQIPGGYVEAMGSVGKAYQQFGASVSAGMQEAQKRADEEAKLQGSLAPYLRKDPRNQAVESALSTGLLRKDEQGNVVIPEENKGKFDLNVANNAIEFYNKTGGDGTRLSGSELTRFATQFEAQRKYDAEQASLDDKRMERLKVQAEIAKLTAEANEKAAGTVGNSIVANYASGGAVPIASAPAPITAPQPSAAPASQGVNLTTYSKPTINEPNYGSTPGFTKPISGFTAERYNAGMELAGKIGSAPAETPSPVTDIPVKSKEDFPPVRYVDVSKNATDVVAFAEQERMVVTNTYSNKRSAAEADYSRALAQLASSGSASPERLKSLKELHEVRMTNLKNGYDANIALIDSRIKSAITISAENRAVTSESLAQKADVRSEEQLKLAKAADQRAVEEGKMKKEEFEIKWGKPTATPATSAGEAKPGTFKAMVRDVVQGAGVIPGRTGGTEGRAAQEAAYTIHQKRMSDYPAVWGLGIFHEGAKEYQIDLNQYPASSPVDPSIRAKVNENVSGYSEAQTFLQKLNDVVNSTDDNAITNYLNRSLWTARQDAKDTNVEGSMMNQFGVAAFRRAIVSGGNFSDADREYVAKLITDINSAHIRKDKDLMIAQTKSLAKFIDSKYRAELAGQHIRFDVKTAKEFLTREGDQAGLQQLSKTEQYVRAFGIDTNDTSKPAIPDVELPSKYEALAKQAKAAGNSQLAKTMQEKADALRAKFDREAEQAKANVEASKAR